MAFRSHISEFAETSARACHFTHSLSLSGPFNISIYLLFFYYRRMEIARLVRAWVFHLSGFSNLMPKLLFFYFFYLLVELFFGCMSAVDCRVWELRNRDRFDISNKIAILKSIPSVATRFRVNVCAEFGSCSRSDLGFGCCWRLSAHWVTAFSSSDLSFPNYKRQSEGKYGPKNWSEHSNYYRIREGSRTESICKCINNIDLC